MFNEQFLELVTKVIRSFDAIHAAWMRHMKYIHASFGQPIVR